MTTMCFVEIVERRLKKKPVPTSSEPPHDACVGSDNVEVQINETDETEEYNYSVEDETRSWRDKILYILGAIVIVGILGACLWNYYSSSQRAEKKIALADSLEKAHQDSIVHLRQIERAKQDSIYKAQQEEKEFLENFYKELDNHLGDEDEMILFRKHLTNRALSFLKDEYPYEDGCDECYATWMFTSEAGCDYDRFICRKIEQESENTFLVTNTWGYEHDSSFKTDYKVRLGIVKEGDSYKINTIENASEKEREHCRIRK